MHPSTNIIYSYKYGVLGKNSYFSIKIYVVGTTYQKKEK